MASSSIADVLNTFITPQLITSIVLVLILIVMWAVSRTIFVRHMKRLESEGDHVSTRKRVTRSIYTIVRYATLFVIVLAILGVNGIDVTALAAAAGAASIIVGFALQDVLNDLAMGLRIVTDNYFSVGDVVRVGDLEGIVLTISPQSTKIRSTIDDSVTTLSNRLLTKVEVVNPQVDIDIPLSYSLTSQEAQALCEEMVANIAALEAVDRAEYKGAQAFEESDVLYKIRLWCQPATRYQTLRDCRRVIQDVLVAHGQEIPYPQIDVHPR